MTRRAVRYFLFATLTLALGSAAWRVFRLEQALAQQQAAADAVERSATTLLDALLDHRAAQRALVAPGQGVSYWKGRIDAARAVIEREAQALRLAGVPSTVPAVERLGETVSDYLRAGARIAAHASADRLHHAADLIFGDAVQAGEALERDVRAARDAIRSEARAGAAAVRTQQAMVIAASAAAALLAALMLVPLPVEKRAETAPPGPIPLDVVDRGPARAAPVPVAPFVPVLPARGAERAASPAALQAAADVCGGLARVQDSRELPALLERMSTVIDARGTILWVADDRGGSLRPTLAHGYASTVLRQMGAIAADGDTPAAHAFRLGEPRTVSGGADQPAALVVPVVSGAGSIGVLTVEVAPGHERQPATLALVRIFAAQLAGLIAPTVASPEAEATAGK